MQLDEGVTLARTLMNQHGLGHWTFQLDRAMRRAGQCRHHGKQISLSRHFVELNPVEEIQDTILHEIAHALAGPGHGHDYYWKTICVKIGARPKRCYDHEHVEMPTGKYKASCPCCQKVFYKHRQVKRTYYCRKCGIKGKLTFQLS